MNAGLIALVACGTVLIVQRIGVIEMDESDLAFETLELLQGLKNGRMGNFVDLAVRQFVGAEEGRVEKGVIDVANDVHGVSRPVSVPAVDVRTVEDCS